jgi:hypothetical protein
VLGNRTPPPARSRSDRPQHPERRRQKTILGARRRFTVNRIPWVIISLAILLSASAANADSVVLIVSAASPIQQLGSAQLRKAFMGFGVLADGVSLRAARNRSDPRLDEIFFQNIVDLSELVYERQLLSRKLQKAAALPTEFFNERQLLDAVARYPGTVSYAWATSAAKRADVRVLRILWHD